MAKRPLSRDWKIWLVGLAIAAALVVYALAAGGPAGEDCDAEDRRKFEAECGFKTVGTSCSVAGQRHKEVGTGATVICVKVAGSNRKRWQRG